MHTYAELSVSKIPTAGSISFHLPRPNKFGLPGSFFVPDSTHSLAVNRIGFPDVAFGRG